MLRVLLDPAFDPRRVVLLETAPEPPPAPAGGAPGQVHLLASDTDHLDLEVDTPGAAVLLVTDSFARGWRAVAMGPAPQPRYEVLPANVALRAVPLAAGHHRLRLEYAPGGFRAGRVISLVALLGWLAAAVAMRGGSRRPETRPRPALITELGRSGRRRTVVASAVVKDRAFKLLPIVVGLLLGWLLVNPPELLAPLGPGRHLVTAAVVLLLLLVFSGAQIAANLPENVTLERVGDGAMARELIVLRDQMMELGFVPVGPPFKVGVCPGGRTPRSHPSRRADLRRGLFTARTAPAGGKSEAR